MYRRREDTPPSDRARSGRQRVRPQPIDGEQARLVAAAFLAAPRSAADPIVRAAYADLGTQASCWYDGLTGSRARDPVRVVYTRCSEPYATGEELAERVRVERVLELCPAHYDRDRRHPLLDTSIGGTYDRLRAVHDLVSHARCGFGFDRDGEYSGWLIEDQIYQGLARRALATELHAEHSVRWTTGIVADHKGTLLPSSVLRASRRPRR